MICHLKIIIMNLTRLFKPNYGNLFLDKMLPGANHAKLRANFSLFYLGGNIYRLVIQPDLIRDPGDVFAIGRPSLSCFV